MVGAPDVSQPLPVAPQAPDRNLALELVRVTEAAAMAAGRWVGRGEKNGADGAAVNAMRQLIGTVSMRGVVVIGEGEKDEAPMLYNGERVGDGTGPEWDIAVDPVDGTTATAKSLPDAVSVLGVSPRGTMFDPGPAVYMKKLVVPGDLASRRPQRPDRRHPGRGRESHRSHHPRTHRCRARPPPTPAVSHRYSARWRPDPLPSRRRR